jgi:hypothetical protein
LKLSVTNGFFWRSEIRLVTVIGPLLDRYRTPYLCPVNLCPEGRLPLSPALLHIRMKQLANHDYHEYHDNHDEWIHSRIFFCRSSRARRLLSSRARISHERCDCRAFPSEVEFSSDLRGSALRKAGHGEDAQLPDSSSHILQGLSERVRNSFRAQWRVPYSF